ncbi:MULTISPECIES: cytidylyltransferase domain-containing protein [Cohnella]|jgi:CMP-N-acetylneuraminic acid synthetase|uniref:acylneuraminate cytidylyltransferase family protein n=1 Tax=Cohnella TaxID=329857 RepID=UPI00037F103C|nr:MULTISPECIES: acylneuraminate cytidylyltransferase family protein [Cohnella]REK63612.1 MAG: acylneuraminate cytidylyltransferase family protein [Cohnella sp.]
MYSNRSVIAIVPARSGSKGIPGKNMRRLAGVSLIGHAGLCLGRLPWLDAKVLSSDSAAYIAEGRRYGLDAPFVRPAELSTDTAGAVETAVHALAEAEKHYGRTFDVILLVEPTSPLRLAEDVERATELLIRSGADSVVTVSAVPSKFHPRKIFGLNGSKLSFYEPEGAGVVYRQALDAKYWRNGVCYALTRDCLLNKRNVITDRTLPLLIDREVVNIDDPIELEWAAFLLRLRKRKEAENR